MHVVAGLGCCLLVVELGVGVDAFIAWALSLAFTGKFEYWQWFVFVVAASLVLGIVGNAFKGASK
jgi:hypothetical protein